jgi:cation transport regulator ChaB
MPGKNKLPSTLKRSPKKAQDTYEKVLGRAEQEYGDDERAHRTAFAALKHSFEKRGDHWETKKHKGPSDPRSAKPTQEKRKGKGETFGGVDYYGHTKDELYDRARRLGIEGRSHMDKKELARAIAKKQ